MGVCSHSKWWRRQFSSLTRRCGSALRALSICSVVGVVVLSAIAAAGQSPAPEWQIQVRKYAEQQDWPAAMRVVEQQIARSPQDTDLLAWRARILTWSGHLAEAEGQYLKILRITRNDPDVWLGLGTVYLREAKTQEALRALDSAVELDPKRADLRAARGRARRAAGESKEARLDFREALLLDPNSTEARSGLSSFDGEARHELRFGEENDLFSFAGPNHGEGVSLTSRWNRGWSTNFAANTYQRGGVEAGKFLGSVTARASAWGAVTVGGATAHDNTVIPKSEAFFDLDHGWKITETGLVRGFEIVYGQHWYWYQSARILALNGSTVFYLPDEWTLTATATGVRSAFSGTGVEWRPSGLARVGFPLKRAPRKQLSGNLFYAAGTEDFAQVDQIGRFASQTYGGGLRFQFTPRQDISGYASYQNRTQNRTDLNFGFSYGIHF